jgi:hypothetical protein
MESKSYSDIEQKYQNLLKLEPKLITSTVPVNAKEQKELFIAGEVEIPQHFYPKLAVEDSVVDEIRMIGESIVSSGSLDKKHEQVYEEFVDRYVEKTRMMQAMYAIKTAETEEAREEARTEFMELNTELYGAPDRDTYASLLTEKIAAIAEKELSNAAQVLFDELRELLPQEYAEGKKVERFKPSAETIKWMQNAVETLYGGMLSHVPEQETFDVHEVRDVFAAILADEFGEAASDWHVDVEEAKSINVKAAEKRIVIPEDRGELTRDDLRKLIVHEIGVHVLRSITGDQTDIGPLRSGLSEYYEAEEGLGKVMEQALTGEFVEAGIDHYITAGAAYFDHKNFPETYELKWRLKALEDLKENDELTDAAINKAKQAAYGGVMRIFRGTDELPWFKDLAYYNGTAGTWEFLEEIQGDDFRLTLLMMGKMNTTDSHLRTVLESRSV